MAQADENHKSLFDEIKDAEASAPRSSTCQIYRVLQDLDDTDRAALIKALADPSIKGTTLTRVLKGRGFAIMDTGLRRHRRGDCSCGES